MPWDVVIFYFVAAIAVLSAIGMVVAANPVHSAIFLVLTFIQIAAVFVMLGAEFLGVIQIIVYTGAILVLLLFVVMLVDLDDLPEFHTGRPIQRVIGGLLGLILLLEVGVAIATRTVEGEQGTATPENIALVGGNTEALGRTLYTEYLLPFEIISLVLTVGVLGAIVLALPERLGARLEFRKDSISLAHPRGTDLVLPAGEIASVAPVGTSRVEPAGVGRRLVMAKDPDDQPVTAGSRTR
jgi:NADH-quinone oxidoreductase subunit J